MSKSIFWALSARTGGLLSFKSQFERDVWQLAELDSAIKCYSLRSPTFSYYDGKRQRKGDFLLFVEKTNGEKELWNPANDRTNLDRPVERARVSMAELLEMNYLQISRADLYANQVAVMNRRTIMGVLATNTGKQDTDELEAAVLAALTQEQHLSIGTLTKQLEADLSLVRLAAFRLCAKGRLAGEDDSYIGPSWKVRRAGI